MPPDQDGEYHMASLRGKDVAALGSQPMEGAPAVWNTYITVASADDGAERVKDGRRDGRDGALRRLRRRPDGRLLRPGGRLLLVWEPKESIGAELVNETGTLSWNELVTDDVDGSKRFYGDASRLADVDVRVRRRRVHDLASAGSRAQAGATGRGRQRHGRDDRLECLARGHAELLARLLRGRRHRRDRRPSRGARRGRRRPGVRRSGGRADGGARAIRRERCSR